LNKTIETLREQYEYHKTMMIKAIGAIEVLEQLQQEEPTNEEEDE
jgi:hypothetical protein